MPHFLTFLKTCFHWALAIASTKKALEFPAKTRLSGRKPQSKRLGFIRTRHLCLKSCGQCVVCKIGHQFEYSYQSLRKPAYPQKRRLFFLNGFERRSRFLSFCKSATSWIIKRLDEKLADVIGSNIVEKCDIRHYREPSNSYIRCFSSLIFPRIFHYLCLRLYRLPMFWSKGWRGLALGEDG